MYEKYTNCKQEVFEKYPRSQWDASKKCPNLKLYYTTYDITKCPVGMSKKCQCQTHTRRISKKCLTYVKHSYVYMIEVTALDRSHSKTVTAYIIPI